MCQKVRSKDKSQNSFSKYWTLQVERRNIKKNQPSETHSDQRVNKTDIDLVRTYIRNIVE